MSGRARDLFGPLANARPVSLQVVVREWQDDSGSNCSETRLYVLDSNGRIWTRTANDWSNPNEQWEEV